MTERYPDDATLLTLQQDARTGVEYIPTGKSPYHLEFRKLLYRLLRATERANDLRVYQDGDLTVGVRPGRALIAATPLPFDGTTGLSLATNTTTQIWLDAAGDLQTGSALPTDRSTFLPLAEVTTDTTHITGLVDRRGETLLQTPDTATLGMTTTADEIDQALDGISSNVTADALNGLTAGYTVSADIHHRHDTLTHDVAGDATLALINQSGDSAANVALRLSLTNLLPYDSELRVNKSNGYLEQRFNNQAYNLLGTVHPQFSHPGAVTGSLTARLIGAVPVDGTVRAVILSAGTNMESSNGADGLTATAKVNGNALTSTAPALTAAVGAGFRCTDQGDGTASVIKTDGTEQVTRGDLLTLDLTRSVSGNVSVEAADVTVLVVIRASQPE